MKNKKMVVTLLASLFVLISACGTKNVEFGKENYQEITSANNILGFKLLEEIEADDNNNVFVSPASLFMALSMVYNGADGETKKEIANALQVEGIEVDVLNKANASLASILQKDSKQIQLEIANSIWINEMYHFQDEFAQNNKDYFNAEIQEMDITDERSVKRINDWVKKSTNKKIEEIVESPLDPDLVAILINAIYFKGDWTYPFAKEVTENRPFHLEDGTTKEVPLMSLSEDLAYLETEKFQAIQLPYGEEEMSMSLFLPQENSNLEEFKTTLTSENWALWNTQFSKQKGTILLPKFQLEYETELNEPLKTLGMGTAFSKGANFGKMIRESDPIWISKVKQKTFIDVNEEGAEAAAVTSVEMVTESAPIDPPFYMEVNRPFFLTITDDETETILFMGWISNPQEG